MTVAALSLLAFISLLSPAAPPDAPKDNLFRAIRNRAARQQGAAASLLRQPAQSDESPVSWVQTASSASHVNVQPVNLLDDDQDDEVDGLAPAPAPGPAPGPAPAGSTTMNPWYTTTTMNPWYTTTTTMNPWYTTTTGGSTTAGSTTGGSTTGGSTTGGSTTGGSTTGGSTTGGSTTGGSTTMNPWYTTTGMAPGAAPGPAPPMMAFGYGTSSTTGFGSSTTGFGMMGCPPGPSPSPSPCGGMTTTQFTSTSVMFGASTSGFAPAPAPPPMAFSTTAPIQFQRRARAPAAAPPAWTTTPPPTTTVPEETTYNPFLVFGTTTTPNPTVNPIFHVMLRDSFNAKLINNAVLHDVAVAASHSPNGYWIASGNGPLVVGLSKR
eukprot:CAMPEP_0204365658 /NCGR_PEP_ID=MMETSP0469-20131031/42074_1 /ASSEMBLY_ACC=CAM_ASM_000384 /TAXON_ID=2969 /ORGANISM="Oxyrrhis marina" /LENGTH=378 /DNA_ID=CAMNT_0051354747 /DNA_START=215 /DNA_END=1351 /DNA_ORIENTATION=+